MLRKATRLTLVEQVAQQIEELIETGTWPVGERIPPEHELVEEFDVSRNTLREAIRALVHAGLLETKQGSGTLVRSTSSLGVAINRHIEKSSIKETLEVRLALEREAAILAAQRRDEEDIKKLSTYIQDCQLAIKENRADKFIKYDLLFHQAIVRASKNKMMYDLYEHLTVPIYQSIREIIAMEKDFPFENEIHSELLQAIIDQDVKSATNYVNKNMEKFKQKWSKIAGGLNK